jgi:hypothetical protein
MGSNCWYSFRYGVNQQALPRVSLLLLSGLVVRVLQYLLGEEGTPRNWPKFLPPTLKSARVN